MKIYISGAITGTTDYMERFSKAQAKLEAEGYMVFNPALVNSNLPEGTTYDEYMSMSFCMLGMCEAINMSPGWKLSNGAWRELGFAKRKGMEIFYGDTEK